MKKSGADRLRLKANAGLGYSNICSFYNKNKVICEEANVQTARLYLTYMVEQVLTAGLNLLGIKVPDHM